ncbi:Rz1-like lysis system protein LysC [Intestinirhabdus alba]
MLFGCSETPSVLISVPVNPVPAHLLSAVPAPPFMVRTWGQYPEYVTRLHLALEQCNADKQAVSDILTLHVKEKKGDGTDYIQKRDGTE